MHRIAGDAIQVGQFLINYLGDGAGAQNLSDVVVSANLPVDLQRDAFGEAIRQYMGISAGTLINAAVLSNQTAAFAQAYAQVPMGNACTLFLQTCVHTQQRLVSSPSCLYWPIVFARIRAFSGSGGNIAHSHPNTYYYNAHPCGYVWALQVWRPFLL